MIHLVYKTVNKINNKIYIGVHSTDNIDDGYMGSGTLIKQAFEKYGKDNFDREILYQFDNPKEAYEKEAELVTEDFVKDSNTYNMTVGGGGTGPGELANAYNKRWTLSDNTKRKISAAKTGDKNPMYGGLTESHKLKLSEVMKEKASRGESHPMYGKSWSEEEKIKRSEWSKNAYANRPNKKCPYCNKEMKPNLYARYHGDKCKLKELS